MLLCDGWVARAGRGASFDRVEDTRPCRVGILLGASPWLADGRPNLYCRYRIDAAEALFKAGKVQYLIVSGDNGRRDYDEPTWIRDELIRRGVPPARIYRDYAGFRTLDTVLRARDVFGLEESLFISQPFHNERALFLARRHGLAAYAFNARDVDARNGLRTRLREKLARMKAVLDVFVFHTGAKFAGPPVVIGATPPT